jgi:pimeloyl-ACP methyl ester carboxylesterase
MYSDRMFKKIISITIIVALLASISPVFAAAVPGFTECTDSIDNDSDGLIDFPDDPGCIDPNDDDEFNAPLVPDPIILVPGIGGSWNWGVMLNSPFSTGWKFTPGAKTYGPFLDALEDQGLELGEEVFVAFYDWRLPNYDSARDYLIPVIDEALGVTGANKVDLVAHSMGGLVARSYIQSDLYRDDVDQMIFNGTPNHGSSDVYSVWEGGNIPNNWELAKRMVLDVYLGYLTRSRSALAWYFKIHEDIMSVAEMLPIYDYVRDIASNVLKPHNLLIEQNPVLGDYSDDLSTLTSRVREVHNIVGNNVLTVGEIPTVVRESDDTPLWVDGKPEPFDPVRNTEAGDGTVPLISAELSGITSVILDTEHKNLLSTGANAIFSALSLTDPGLVALPNEPDSALGLWFASPVAPKVIGPDGAYITKDFSSIPDAEYDGEPDPNGVKIIYIPNPLLGEYRIELTATGDGEYHLGTIYLDEDSDAGSITQGTIATGQTIKYLFELSGTETEELQVSELTANYLLQKMLDLLEAYRAAGAITKAGFYWQLRARLGTLKVLNENATKLAEQLNSTPAWLAKLLANGVAGMQGNVLRQLGSLIDFLKAQSNSGLSESAAAELIDVAGEIKDLL